MNLVRMKNRMIAKIITRFPSLAKGMIESYAPWESGDVPWAEMKKPLKECTIAIVTTAGVHHKDQQPFDMTDRQGDPSYRELDESRPVSDLMITHDYYDHADADRDINIVYPIDRLRELADEGVIGRVAGRHFGFMGHIDGRHVVTLVDVTAPSVARRCREEGVDAVILSPG